MRDFPLPSPAMRLLALACRGLGAVGLCSVLAAQAATPVPTTKSFAVAATVSSGCWVVGNVTQVSGIGFGMLDFGSHPAVTAGDYTAAITMANSPAQVQCTPGATVTVTVDGGLNALGAQRRLRFGTHYLPYVLTTLPGGGVSILPGVGLAVDASAGPTLLPVYGRATAPGTGVPAGHYTDTLQVVFSW